MTYRLRFLEDAEKEWRKLDANTRSQFQKKLVARLEHPRVPSAQLRGRRDLLRASYLGETAVPGAA